MEYHIENSKGESFVDEIAAIKERISISNTFKSSVPEILGADTIRIDELRGVNKNLQKEIGQKTMEIESLHHELFE